MKYYKAIFTLLIIVFGGISSQAQCSNKISVTSKLNDSEQGIVYVYVESDTNYICTLYMETASGDSLIGKKTGRGNKKIEFDNLLSGNLYSVKVEFADSKEFLCSKLSKTIILK